MGRGRGSNIASSDGGGRPRRVARAIVQDLYGQRLRSLASEDRYRLGDVGRRLLAAFCIDLKDSTRQSRPRLKEVLPDRAEIVDIVGISGALVSDGVAPLASLQQTLEQRVREGSDLNDASGPFDEALTQFRREARDRREAELDWMTEHLHFCPEPASGPWDETPKRALLVDIWLNKAGPGELNQLAADVLRRSR